MSTVDGVVKGPDAHGVVQGDGGAVDRMAGDAGSNRLEGHAALNLYFGGAGNDTFIIADKFAVAGGDVNKVSTVFLDQTSYVNDFHGAGTSTGEQDFIAFQDYLPGSLTLNHTGVSGSGGDAVLYYYSVQDVQGNTHNVIVNSLNGNPLSQGDFNFVGLTV